MQDRLVHFKIDDIYLPDPVQILRALHGQDLLQGKVVDVSDSGMETDAFAVVEVEGVDQPVVVPLKRIRGIL